LDLSNFGLVIGFWYEAEQSRLDSQPSGLPNMLREQGADDVIIDTGSIAEEVKARYPEGVDKVLELVGVTTM
jgi:hypothetical protein